MSAVVIDWRDVVARRMDMLELTERKREVLWHLLAGYNTEEIANSLFISEQTVKNHIWHVYDKLGLTVEPGSSRRIRLVMLLLGVDIYALRRQLVALENEKKG